MPPRLNSRHTFTLGVLDEDDRTLLTDRVPYRFQNLSDNIQHVVGEGDSLQSVAAKYYRGFPRPAGLWWVIADYQPEPIHDPTLELDAGRVLFVPSLRTLQEEILSERRRYESVL